jgi:uncharacterized membrane protein YdjX (TVP38/TMEM64 family)
MTQTILRLIIFAIIVTTLIAGYIILSQMGVTTFLEDGAALKQWVQQLGITGPLIIIGLMTTAIIMSPIPSAPIALAAGAAYGHTVGTVYVAIGSELGAIIAFFIARLVGVEILQKWVDDRLSKTILGSQRSLMGVVFISRLLPFISFDMVSYAAGVTPLRFWRFAVATLAGIIPASFLLAHFGAELASGENQRIGITLLLLGAASLIFILANWLSNRH